MYIILVVESVTKPIYESPIDKREDSEDICTSESMDVEKNLERHDKDEIVEEEMESESEEDVIAEKDKSPDINSSVASASDQSDEEYTPYNANNQKGPLTQEKVNDLIRDLGLPKDRA